VGRESGEGEGYGGEAQAVGGDEAGEAHGVGGMDG
jgi:hypothetical protein